MKNDGYDHLREQVKKLCDIAMVKVWPGKDGYSPPGQANVLAWMIVPEPWSYYHSELEEITEFEIPSVHFGVLGMELAMNMSPERIADLVQARFQGAVMDLWELVGQDIKRRNMERMKEFYEKQ